jgi:hypothetical protein
MTISTIDQTGLNNPLSLTSPTISSGSILNSSGRPMVAQTGSVLQVAYTYFDGYTTSAASGAPNVITNGAQIFSISFTPVSATSQLLVQTSAIVIAEESNAADIGWLSLWDGSTFICANSGTALYNRFVSNLNMGCYSLNNMYASGSTSTRTIQARAGYNGGTAVINGNTGGYVYTGSSARVGMTVMEIAG